MVNQTASFVEQVADIVKIQDDKKSEPFIAEEPKEGKTQIKDHYVEHQTQSLAVKDDFSDLVSAVHSINSPSQKPFLLTRLSQDKMGKGLTPAFRSLEMNHRRSTTEMHEDEKWFKDTQEENKNKDGTTTPRYTS